PVFDDEGLTPETTYLYEVSAVNGDGLESTRGGPAGATTPPDDSGPGDGDIVGHWRFDEGSGTVAADASGNGNLGTLMNGPIWVPGYSGTALSFDGIDDYVLVPDDDALNMVADFTISVWVKWSGANADADILRKGSAGTSVAHYKIELKDNRLKVRLVGIQRSTVLSDNQTGRGDGVWHNVVVTREGTVSRLYIDGALIASSNTNVGDMSNSANLAFGAKDTGTSDFFRGSIDDIRFYSRALSAQEIGNLGAMPMLVRGSN
ncbi:MAG: LamG domain-containing protein, partial [Gemmatimonadota bacterium]